jgi:hypothetical protein
LHIIIIKMNLPILLHGRLTDSKMGHALELPFEGKLLEHSKKDVTVFPIDQIYCIGMVGKQGMMYAKSSCDFIARINTDGEKMLVGVECEARVTPGAQQ